jgi:type I site-specific restriction endonuclease
VTPILETERDRALERRAIERIVAGSAQAKRALKLPDLSAVDFLLLDEAGKPLAFVEIKTRKESAEQVMGYGGLMLKHRKLSEMQQISALLQVPSHVAFCFENAEGSVWLAEAQRISDVEPVIPPPRRNFRGLPCDDEPVVFLDWAKHMRRML